MASPTKKTEGKSKNTTEPGKPKEKELETEGPLSEKDEVKKAEQKMNKAAKKTS